jgi:hypothetical protein
MDGGTHGEARLEGVVTFEGTIHALRAEKQVRGAGVACRLVPTPRELSSTCALALAFGRDDRDRVASVLARHGLRFAAIHLYSEGGGEPVPWPS